MLGAASVRQRRGPKRAVDAWAPPALLREAERTPGGALVAAVAVFLVGAECPFTCVFCDLWRGTLDAPTPPGALPRQLDAAAAELGAGLGVDGPALLRERAEILGIAPDGRTSAGGTCKLER
ncbi:MAG TPA: hypothetical protein VLA66_00150, partial [Thermoanaerobaculia bacterium]|nr:hypothetical protein [Thermoanaerobaculia bacterium]